MRTQRPLPNRELDPVLFGHAEPYGEPVVAYGPFVMNTREQNVKAIRDDQMGSFR